MSFIIRATKRSADAWLASLSEIASKKEEDLQLFLEQVKMIKEKVEAHVSGSAPPEPVSLVDFALLLALWSALLLTSQSCQALSVIWLEVPMGT